MMTPFDTAILKHRPDHLRLPAEAERLAARLSRPKRIGLRGILKSGLAFFLRGGRGIARRSPAAGRS